MNHVVRQLNSSLLRDPFWHFSIACYVLHKCWQALNAESGWMDYYWNDVWMLPCAIPLVLSVYNALGLRQSMEIPSGFEILWHGILWGLIAEFVGPLLFVHAVGDPWDLAAYAVGGFLLYFRWHLPITTESSLAIRF